MKPGQLVSGKYRLVRRLGTGGMAEVWAATNVLTHRDFAVKFILPALAENDEAVQRFFQEAKAAGRVRHPSIVDVFDVGHSELGQPFLVMELLSGESLESRLLRAGPVDPLEGASWLAQIARGLDLAHRAGVVHRDLSSANVFLATSSAPGELVPKILDFGVSKVLTPGLDVRVRTGNGAVLGSPAYMSPEQARGAANVDARTDVWTLGVLLYESFSGKQPFVARNYNALMLAILSVPHTPILELVPKLDAELARVIESCPSSRTEKHELRLLEVAAELELRATLVAFHFAAGPQRRATDRLPRSEPPSHRPSKPLRGRGCPATFPMACDSAVRPRPAERPMQGAVGNG
ncbi:MAG: serine/threonine-protein kinase [Polyangiaceae bacterium]